MGLIEETEQGRETRAVAYLHFFDDFRIQSSFFLHLHCLNQTPPNSQPSTLSLSLWQWNCSSFSPSVHMDEWLLYFSPIFIKLNPTNQKRRYLCGCQSRSWGFQSLNKTQNLRGNQNEWFRPSRIWLLRVCWSWSHWQIWQGRLN